MRTLSILLATVVLCFICCDNKKLPLSSEVISASKTNAIQSGNNSPLVFEQEEQEHLRAYYNGNRAMELWRGAISFYNTNGVEVVSLGPCGIGEYGGQFVAKTAENTNTCKMTGGGFYFGGNKVVGARQPAIANAITPEDLVVQFNKLLEVCRAHGLIEEETALAAK